MSNDLIDQSEEAFFAGCGPAMRDISERWRRFVLGLMAHGYNATRAAAEAGYNGTPEVLASTGARLRRHPKIIAAMQEEALSRLNADVLMATGTLAEIAADPTAKHAVRVKAAEAILNRVPAFVVEKKQKIVVEHKASNLKEQIEDLLRLCSLANRDPRAVMGDEYYNKAIEYGLVRDAEFVIVEPTDFSGLEDVI